MAAVLRELLYLCLRTVDGCKPLIRNGFSDIGGPCYSADSTLFRSFAGYINS